MKVPRVLIVLNNEAMPCRYGMVSFRKKKQCVSCALSEQYEVTTWYEVLDSDELEIMCETKMTIFGASNRVGMSWGFKSWPPMANIDGTKIMNE